MVGYVNIEAIGLSYPRIKDKTGDRTLKTT